MKKGFDWAKYEDKNQTGSSNVSREKNTETPDKLFITNKKVLQNDDGSISTERGISVEHPGLNNGRPTNIPTIWDGKEVSKHQAIKNAIASGQKFDSYNTIDEAVQGSKLRSQYLGDAYQRQLQEKQDQTNSTNEGGFDWSKYEDKDQNVPRGNEENIENIEPEQKEEPSIGKDFLDTLLNVPSDVMDLAVNLPGEVYGLGKGIVTNPLRTAKVGLAGVGEGVHGKANYAGNIRDWLVSRKLLGEDTPSLRLPESILPKKISFDEMLGIKDEQPGDALLKFITGFGSFKHGTGFGAVNKLPKAAENAAQLGSYAISQNQNPLEAILLGKTMEGAAKLAGKGIEGARNFNRYESQLSPEELRFNLENAEGTNTPLGRVIEDPRLARKFENKLIDYPGSGAGEKMQEIGKQVTERGHELVKKLGEENSNENYGDLTSKAISDAYSYAQKEKSSNYKKVNKIADKQGIKIDVFDFDKTARTKLAEINSSPLLKISIKKDIVKKLKEYSDIGEIQKSNKKTDINNLIGKFNVFLEKTNQPGKNKINEKEIENKIRKTPGTFQRKEGGDITLKDANTFKSVLKDIADDYFNNGNTYAGQMYKNLRSSLVNDINRTINKSGNKELRSEYDKAEDYYAKSIAPFDEREVKKFITGGGDPNVILDTFIKKNKDSDRSYLLNKLLKVLPKKEQNIVRKGYYRRSIEDEEFNPNKFNKLHKSLGKNQRSLLINDPKLEKEFDNYSKLVEQNQESLNAMFNPKNGQKGLSFMPTMLSALGGALGSGSLGAVAGIAGGIPGLLGGLALPAIVARHATNRLTSPKVREKVVNKLIEKKERKADKGKHDLKTIEEEVLKTILSKSKKLPKLIGQISPTEIELEKKRERNGY